MAEPMVEVTEAAALEEAVKLYPGTRKVTVDLVNGKAYVFGLGNRATTVTDAEFDALVGVLPGVAVGTTGQDPKVTEPKADAEKPEAAGEEPADEPEKTQPKRGKKEN